MIMDRFFSSFSANSWRIENDKKKKNERNIILGIKFSLFLTVVVVVVPLFISFYSNT